MTALSGSGPAYFYFLVEAMTDAGILLGLPRQVAHDLIVQTAIGSAIMLRDSGEHPVKLREAVTSPAGTTISAIRELENHGGTGGVAGRAGSGPRPGAGDRGPADLSRVTVRMRAAALVAGAAHKLCGRGDPGRPCRRTRPRRARTATRARAALRRRR